MKKTLSILLSIIMMLSITAGLDFSAYANDPDNAPTLPTNGTYVQGNLTQNDDAKYYRFTIPSDGTVTFKLMTYCYYTDLYLYDEDVANGRQLICPSGSVAEPSTGSVDLVMSKGSYYIKVSTHSSTSNSYGKFKVQADFKSFNTTNIEPNNDNETAMSLSKNTLVTGALTQQDDADWYKFIVTSNCKVTLSFTHYFNRYFDLYRSGNYTDSVCNNHSGDPGCTYGYDEGTATSPYTDKFTVDLKSGTYFVKVSKGDTGKYTFKWTATCSSHTYKTTVTPATTKANGKIVRKCTVCGVTSTSTIYYPKTITLSATSYTYNGKVRKPSVTVKGSNGKTISSGNYTVTYPSGRKNVGTYTVTINFKGNYSGTVKRTFTIKPKATGISRLTAGRKKFSVKWNKITAQTTGYQIQYSTSSRFKGAKTITITKNSTSSKTVSKLKGKKKYYVRVRTYKTVNGKKIYSSWSKAKSVTTK